MKKRKAEAEPTPSAKKTKTEDEGIKNLFIGNLSWNIDEEWLSREFTEFGEITGCRIITDKNTGKAKGLAICFPYFRVRLLTCQDLVMSNLPLPQLLKLL